MSVAVLVAAGLTFSYVKAGSIASSTPQDCTVVVKSVSELRNALISAQKNNMSDVICIQAGTYKVTQPLIYNTEDGDDEHNLTIKALDGRVVLDGDSKTQIMIIDTDTDNNGKGDWGDIIVEGITFQKGLASKYGGGLLIKTGNAGITLINNTFSANQAHSGAGGYLYSYSGTIYIVSNVFYNNSATHYGGGVYVHSFAGKILLINNTFVSNNAFEYYGGGAFVRVDKELGSRVSIYNNIFWQNVAHAGGNDGEDLYIDSGGDRNDRLPELELHNNNFSGNANFAGGKSEDLYIRRVDYSKYRQSGNIQADPRFVGVADFRLKEGSPCIDAGRNDVPGLPQADRGGKPRINGRAVVWGLTSFSALVKPQ